jgi:hypothetical protein
LAVAGVSDARRAVHVHSDQHRRLHSRRQHERVARQHRIDAAIAIPSGATGQKSLTIVADIPIGDAQFNAILRAIWRIGGRARRASGYVGKLIADQAALMGCADVFYIYAVFAARAGTVRLDLDTADRAGERPNRSG